MINTLSQVLSILAQGNNIQNIGQTATQNFDSNFSNYEYKDHKQFDRHGFSNPNPFVHHFQPQTAPVLDLPYQYLTQRFEMLETKMTEYMKTVDDNLKCIQENFTMKHITIPVLNTPNVALSQRPERLETGMSGIMKEDNTKDPKDSLVTSHNTAPVIEFPVSKSSWLSETENLEAKVSNNMNILELNQLKTRLGHLNRVITQRVRLLKPSDEQKQPGNSQQKSKTSLMGTGNKTISQVATDQQHTVKKSSSLSQIDQKWDSVKPKPYSSRSNPPVAFLRNKCDMHYIQFFDWDHLTRENDIADMIESKFSHIASNLIRVSIFYPKNKSPRTQIWFDEHVSYRDITNFANRFASLSVESDYRLLFAGGYEPPATFKRKTAKIPTTPIVITTKLPEKVLQRGNNSIVSSNQPQWRKKVNILDTIVEESKNDSPSTTLPELLIQVEDSQKSKVVNEESMVVIDSKIDDNVETLIWQSNDTDMTSADLVAETLINFPAQLKEQLEDYTSEDVIPIQNTDEIISYESQSIDDNDSEISLQDINKSLLPISKVVQPTRRSLRSNSKQESSNP